MGFVRVVDSHGIRYVRMRETSLLAFVLPASPKSKVSKSVRRQLFSAAISVEIVALSPDLRLNQIVGKLQTAVIWMKILLFLRNDLMFLIPVSPFCSRRVIFSLLRVRGNCLVLYDERSMIGRREVAV